MAFFIDFNKNSDTIVYDLFHSSDNIPDDDNMLFDYFKFLHLFRHNLLHSLVLKMFGQNWQEEKPLAEFFDCLTVEEGRKTPDICIQINNVWYVIDVSVSMDVAKTKNKKKEKYQPIVDHLNKEGIKSKYITVGFQSNHSNILEELKQLDDIKQADFNFQLFERTMNIIEDKKEFVHNKIDKEKFDLLKKEYFNKQNNNNNNIKKEKQDYEIIFKDELLYENIGTYNDLSISQEMFEKHNSNFCFEKRIKDTLAVFPEEQELIDYFKNVLEEKTSVYKKYADKKLEDEQFEEADKTVQFKK